MIWVNLTKLVKEKMPDWKIVGTCDNCVEAVYNFGSMEVSIIIEDGKDNTFYTTTTVSLLIGIFYCTSNSEFDNTEELVKYLQHLDKIDTDEFEEVIKEINVTLKNHFKDIFK